MLKAGAASILAAAAFLTLVGGSVAAAGHTAAFTLVSEFDVQDAGQGVAVDREHFYAVDSRAIAKHDKRTGARVARWQETADGPITHLDGAVIHEGRLYAAHSNYPRWPMTSSLEIWDAWVLPRAVLERLGQMSNSGGSWGPDGFLYLTGHDPAELYSMRLPRAGPALELAAIVSLSIRGQGIAWDRSSPGMLYTTVRATPQQRAAGIGNKVRVFRMTGG